MDIVKQLVRGYTWRARMSNGAIFEIWTPFKIRQSQAKTLMLDFANADIQIYDSQDIESIWSTNGTGYIRVDA